MTNRPGDRSISPRRLFGAELRRRREAAGLTQEELGELAFCAAPLVAHFEAGYRLPSAETARRLDKALRTGGSLATLHSGLPPAASGDRFREVAELEAEADGLYAYGVALVPGLCQTEAYARAALGAGLPGGRAGEVDGHVVERMARARLLDKPGLAIGILLYEAVLRAVVGDHGVMAAQLRRLAELVRAGRVLLQVVPLGAGTPPAGGLVNLMTFADTPDVAYTEDVLGASHTDDPVQVRRCWEAHDLARSAALPPAASLALLEAAAEEHRRAHESRFARAAAARPAG